MQSQQFLDATLLAEKSTHEKQNELTAMSIWLTDLVGIFPASYAVTMLSDEWSEDQGVFGEERGIKTIYYKDWHISYSKAGKFKIENLAVDSDDEAFFSYLIDGLKTLGQKK